VIDPTQYTPEELARNLAKTVRVLVQAGRPQDTAIKDVAVAWALSQAQIKLIKEELE
jgi:hypothetical protein